MAYRWGLIHKVVPAPRTEEAALQLAGAGRRAPARGRRAAEADAARVATGSRSRSRVEGEGQVEWARTGPGLPYRE